MGYSQDADSTTRHCSSNKTVFVADVPISIPIMYFIYGTPSLCVQAHIQCIQYVHYFTFPQIKTVYIKICQNAFWHYVPRHTFFVTEYIMIKNQDQLLSLYYVVSLQPALHRYFLRIHTAYSAETALFSLTNANRHDTIVLYLMCLSTFLTVL